VGGDGGGDLFGRAVLEGVVTEGGAPGGRNPGGGGIHWQARDKSLLRWLSQLEEARGIIIFHVVTDRRIANT
jgi:hypothetical protein